MGAVYDCDLFHYLSKRILILSSPLLLSISQRRWTSRRDPLKKPDKKK